MASLNDIIGNAKLSTTAFGAGSSLLGTLAQGDIAGAINTVTNTLGDAVSVFAASGGVNPGDAFKGMQARTDALQNWCWYCLPPPIDNSNSLTLGGLSSQVSLPWYYVVRSNLPTRSISYGGSTIRNGRTTHYPESYSVADITIDLFLDSSNAAMLWAKAWQGQVLGNRDPSQATNQGGWGLPSKYKKTLNFVLLNVKRQQVMNIKYINCSPSDLQAFDVVSDTSGLLTTSLTLKVEDVDVTLSNDIGLVDSLSNLSGGYAMSAISSIASPYLNQLGDIAANIITT